MKRHAYGYYHIAISAGDGAPLIRSNNERAFVISQLHYFLSPRLILGEVPAHKQLASCIDLLAFSIRSDAIRFVMFSIDPSISRYFISCITERFSLYCDEHRALRPPANPLPLRVSIKKLAGPHQALSESVALHLLHEDWEYDRYSSIGFYLHDRRGDWMRTWRLAQLYENKPEYYLGLIHNKLYRNSFMTSGVSQYLAQ